MNKRKMTKEKLYAFDENDLLVEICGEDFDVKLDKQLKRILER